MTKLCVLTTHPIQYISPWYKELHSCSEIDLHVCYLRELNSVSQGTDFNTIFNWDIPLREGFDSSVLEVGRSFFSPFKAVFKLTWLLRKHNFDAVLITGWNDPSLIIAYPLVKILGVKLIVRGESNDLRVRGWKQRFFHRILLHLPDAFLSIGKSNSRFYESYGIAPSKIHDGCYFVENSRLLAMADAKKDLKLSLRSEYGFCDGDFVFAFLGKHVHFKRPGMLVEAARELSKMGVNVCLLFGGSGALTEDLKNSCEASGTKAFFPGFVNQTQLWRVYTAADAFVLPSTSRETWGLVTNEAMVFSLPTIVSAEVGCAEDLVEQGATGFIFDGSLADLIEKMYALCSNPEMAMKMGDNARTRVLNAYSTNRATKGVLSALKRV